MTEMFQCLEEANSLEKSVFSLEGLVDENGKSNEFNVDLYLSGLTEEFILVPAKNDQSYQPITDLPLGLGEEFAFPHDVKRELEESFLLPPTCFPSPLIQKSQYLPPLEKEKIESLLQRKPLPSQVSIELLWDPLTGKHVGCTMVPQSLLTQTSFNSTSMLRSFNAMENYVRGKSNYLPFAPSGVEVIESTLNSLDLNVDHDPLFTIAPGMDRGLILDANEASEAVAVSTLMDLAIKPVPEEMDIISTSYFENEQAVSVENNALHLEKTQDLAKSIPQGVMSQEEANGTSYVDQIMLDMKMNSSKIDCQSKREWAREVTDPMKNFHTLVPELATPFPFELDAFQKQAVYHLEQGHSVFVAAHTSAGKTVVAEYAIGLSQRHMTKTIYTSPIKALSNQKFRDLSEKFNVGILTGDLQINKEGDCLIMTTEILRSMLYKGADLIRDVEFVIFDEVHYVNDFERGVVWEEVIIMLPAHIKLILLSATVPNTKEFADWVGRTQKKDIYVISTTTRPVPLEHFLYIPPAKEYFKIVDAKKQFLEVGIKLALSKLSKPPTKEKISGGPGGNTKTKNKAPAKPPPKIKHIHHLSRPDRNTFIHLVYLLKDRGLLPTVIFTFSRKNCEFYADFLSSMDLLTGSEKAGVHLFIRKALSRLHREDQALPQIIRMKEMLSRGLGVHHGGLLPLVKEMVEILFAKGLVKILFATETFAMGVNMPAKCVVFSSTRKNDGIQFRDLLPGEYIQMSGRAGRRGLDSTGVVLLLCMEPPVVADLQHMLLGKPTLLNSQFRLTFSMILNLLRTASFQVEDMMKRSFCEHGAMKSLPSAQKSYNTLTQRLNELPVLECLVCQTDLEDYFATSQELMEITERLHAQALPSALGSKVMVVGRVLVLCSKKYRNVLGVVVGKLSSTKFVVSSLVNAHSYCAAGASESNVKLALPPTHLSLPPSDGAMVRPSTVMLPEIAWVTSCTLGSDLLKHPPLLLRGLQDVAKAVQDSPTGLAYDWSKLKDIDFQMAWYHRQTLAAQLVKYTCLNCPEFPAHYSLMQQRKELESRWVELHSKLTYQNLEFLPEYQQRLLVLQALQYVDSKDTVLLKGRVACEIHSGNELILTELLFHNFFAAMDLPETIAVLSLFLFQEKSTANLPPPVLTAALEAALSQLETIQMRLWEVLEAHGLGNVLSPLNFGLFQVAYAWAQGIAFHRIMPLANGVLEGSIVRTIVRIEETCRELKDAARLMGDAALFVKMELASAAIKRDIVFCGSLYIE